MEPYGQPLSAAETVLARRGQLKCFDYKIRITYVLLIIVN
jgi:hypothetical protein